MLLIKRMFNFFKKKYDDSYTPDFDNDKIIIKLGLTDNYEIDIAIEINDLSVDNEADMLFKSQKIAQFFNTIFSGKINSNISQIILNQIGDEEKYKHFVDSIIYNWILMEKNDTEEEKNSIDNIPLIKPTQVFMKYTHEA